MKWLNESGQAAVEFAIIIPLVALLLLVIIACGYGAAAQLLVISATSQGARLGAARCEEQAEPSAVLAAAQEKALAMLAPLPGPRAVTAQFDGEDLLVTSTYTYTPPLPGAEALFGESLVIGHALRYYCGVGSNPAPPPS